MYSHNGCATDAVVTRNLQAAVKSWNKTKDVRGSGDGHGQGVQNQRLGVSPDNGCNVRFTGQFMLQNQCMRHIAPLKMYQPILQRRLRFMILQLATCNLQHCKGFWRLRGFHEILERSLHLNADAAIKSLDTCRSNVAQGVARRLKHTPPRYHTRNARVRSSK